MIGKIYPSKTIQINRVVGFEDNFYLSPGVMAQGNGPLVEKTVRMTRDIGREPATREEARAILGLGEMKAKAEGPN